jgi:hypothetical protein
MQNLNIVWRVKIEFIFIKLHMHPDVPGCVLQHRAASLFLQLRNVLFRITFSLSAFISCGQRDETDHVVQCKFKTQRYWNVTPCSPLRVNQCFAGTYRLHLQGWKVSQARNQHEYIQQAECIYILKIICLDDCLLHADFLLGLVFNPEKGSDMFLRNVGWLSMYYTAFYSS